MKPEPWLTYMDQPCPRCGSRIPEPFVRGSVLHYRHTYGDYCDLIIAVHPESENHTLTVVAPEELYEQTMARVVAALDWADENRVA